MAEKITLGGREFELRPLKLGQLRHLLDALDEMSGKSGGALIEAAAKVVAAGLAPAHPGLVADALLDLEAGIEELNAAVAAVLRIAGLRPKEEDGTGEAKPVASSGPVPATSSAPSMAPSPPAAATATPSSTI
jgi:hypothetical protein